MHCCPVFSHSNLCIVLFSSYCSLSHCCCALGWGPANPHPAAAVMMQLWPHLAVLFSKLNCNDHAIEDLCRCIKYSLKSARVHSQELLQHVAPQVVLAFKDQPWCSYLDLASQLIAQLYTEPQLHPVFAGMIQEMSVTACSVLNTSDAFAKDPDLVEDYFELLKRVMSKIPQMLMQLPTLQQVIQCSLLGVCIEHKEAARSVLSFWENLLELAIRPDTAQQCGQAVVSLLAMFGTQLVHLLFTTAGAGIQMSKLNRIGRIFRRIYLLAVHIPGQNAAQWVAGVLQSYTFLSDADKKAVLDGMTNASAVQDDSADTEFGRLIGDFSHVCRIAARQQANPP